MKTFVMIPTYNEKENIRNLIDIILKLKIENLHVVVVDDNSPDGTWKIVQDISKKNRNVHLLLRKKDKGRGAAGREGFIYCLKHGADEVVEIANRRRIVALEDAVTDVCSGCFSVLAVESRRVHSVPRPD